MEQLARKWRKRLSPITLLIGIVFYALGYKYGLIATMITASICIVTSLISMVY